MPLEDLRQIAALGLIKAVDRFDPDNGAAFSSFAVPTMQGEIRRYLRDFTWTVRPPRELQERALDIARERDQLTSDLRRSPTAAELAQRLGCTIEDILEAAEAGQARGSDSFDRSLAPDDGDDATTLAERLGAEDPGFAGAETTATLDDLLATISKRDALAVQLRFREELTQAEIGRRIGCCRCTSRASCAPPSPSSASTHTLPPRRPSDRRESSFSTELAVARVGSVRMDDAALTRFADLAIGFGANVQPDQIVALECEPGKEYLVRALAASAYRHGARFVDVAWFDPHVKHARIRHAKPQTLDFVPPWYGERLLALGDSRAAYVGLSGASAPALLSDLDPALVGKDRLPMLKEATKVIDDRTINWTAVPCPTPAWAQLVFPELDPAGALERLEREVLHVLRLDEEDPIAAWRARVDTLVAAAAP